VIEALLSLTTRRRHKSRLRNIRSWLRVRPRTSCRTGGDAPAGHSPREL